MALADPRKSSVLITGAAGSIGSELARALARGGVERLVLLDFCEAGLLAAADSVAAEAVPGDAGDPAVLDALFQRARFDIVYHAAAWKHVPLLENEPFAAVENNALATYTLAQAVARARIPRMVLLSTDKAVNPRSILGASKRIAELAVTSLTGPDCRMNAIRLCNVFDSSGSVVPIFRDQIARGGPVTITDRHATRWFLTMEQAVAAIRQAGRSGQSGKILLPSVGDPVLIRELAAGLLRSSGGSAGIQYIGLRPGEKRTEELLGAREREIGHEGDLTVVETSRLETGEATVLFRDLAVSIGNRDLPGLLSTIRSFVPEYQPSDLLLRRAAVAAGTTV